MRRILTACATVAAAGMLMLTGAAPSHAAQAHHAAPAGCIDFSFAASVVTGLAEASLIVEGAGCESLVIDASATGEAVRVDGVGLVVG
ncbi:hypothetical protein [Streptomyces sp. XD-27]|uniref:hypothetical protein n=1 Tax=Streptomyces sp. XD-27 TaxID=3062779 RepID=UPI0026F467CA|nr:hypothetical protein [Streptomyces sp. XD-27]WKX70944.1 hypothetical protein Q3Y56_14445 [Streptomyces sp. XD-27]